MLLAAKFADMIDMPQHIINGDLITLRYKPRYIGNADKSLQRDNRFNLIVG
ncbi:hypothetical protein D3C84_1022330 [compost metagenome]